MGFLVTDVEFLGLEEERRSHDVLEDEKQVLEVLEESNHHSSFQGIWEDLHSTDILLVWNVYRKTL